MRRGQVLAVDLGGTNVRLGMVAGDGRILRRRRTRIPAVTSREALYEALTGKIRGFMSAGSRGDDPEAVAVGFAGLTNSSAGYIYYAPNVGQLRDIKLARELEVRLDLPVVVANDANCAAMGEAWHGVGVGAGSLFMFTLGTGVGGSFVIDGEVWEGAWGIAGEIGHTIVAAGGPLCNCGKRGCLDALAAGSAMIREYIGRARIKSEEKRRSITAKAVFDRARRGDRIANKVVADAARALGIGIANVFNLLNPELVVIGGGVSRAGSRFLAPAVEHAREYVFPPLRDKLKVRRAGLGDGGALIGAAHIAFNRLG